VTLSRQQVRHVRDRIAALGLDDGSVEVRLQDYRDLPASGAAGFDAIATVEMGEHVGEQAYPQFAAGLFQLVRPGGRVLVQQMSRGVGAPDGGAFISAYVAPDLHMRPLGDTVSLLEQAGLEIRDTEAMREHYVRTIRAWHATLERRWDGAVEVVGEQVARVWRLYLAGTALSFEQRRAGVDQILAVRPTGDGTSGMPPTRHEWVR
jgi:cyclopropane-fatty-acyl-phospholipid synthase